MTFEGRRSYGGKYIHQGLNQCRLLSVPLRSNKIPLSVSKRFHMQRIHVHDPNATWRHCPCALQQMTFWRCKLPSPALKQFSNETSNPCSDVWLVDAGRSVTGAPQSPTLLWEIRKQSNERTNKIQYVYKHIYTKTTFYTHNQVYCLQPTTLSTLICLRHVTAKRAILMFGITVPLLQIQN